MIRWIADLITTRGVLPQLPHPPLGQVLESMLASTDTTSKDFDKDTLRRVAMANYDLELAWAQIDF